LTFDVFEIGGIAFAITGIYVSDWLESQLSVTTVPPLTVKNDDGDVSKAATNPQTA